MRAFGTSVIVATLLMALSGCGSSKPSVTQSPKAQLAAVLAKVRAQRSVHYETRSSLGYTAIGDVSGTGGIEHLAFEYGPNGFRLDVLLVGGSAYVRGDAGGLQALGLLSPANASRYAHAWLVIGPDDRRYATVTHGVDFAAFLRGIAPPAGAHIAARETTIQPYQSARLSGTKVIRLGLDSKARTQVIEVPSAGGLPMAALSGTGSGVQESTLLSRWDEPVHIAAPTHAVAIATIER
jgi:hypothetical protein